MKKCIKASRNLNKSILEEIEKKLYEAFRKNDLYPEGLWVETGSMVNKINYEIRGDWKHDHLFSEYVVKEVLSEYPDIRIIRSTSAVTEEDGSDWYTAIHTFWID